MLLHHFISHHEIDKITLPLHSCDADILSMSVILFMWLGKQYGIQQLDHVPLISTCATIHRYKL